MCLLNLIGSLIWSGFNIVMIILLVTICVAATRMMFKGSYSFTNLSILFVCIYGLDLLLGFKLSYIFLVGGLGADPYGMSGAFVVIGFVIGVISSLVRS